MSKRKPGPLEAFRKLSEASARLVAAAPELLVALQAVELVTAFLPDSVVHVVKAAIAKATGGDK